MNSKLQYLFLFLIIIILPDGISYGDDSWRCGTLELIKSGEVSHAPLIMAEEVYPAPRSQVGDQLNFYIHIPNGKVRATCKRVGKHAYIFVDNAVLNLVKEADLDDIIDTFDNKTYPQVHAYFGTEWKPGIDMDTRIVLLLHDVQNNGSIAGFGGYFSQQDEIPNAINSNHREMIYVDVYCPTQKRHALHSIIAHEFTHMLNWFQNGGSTDEQWLEEGIASFSEWKLYDYVHWIYVEHFFNDPSTSLVSSNSHDISYGASFLFLLYLYEKYGGKKIIKEIVREDRRGIAAINAALEKFGYEDRFGDVFNKWVVANLVNDTRQNSLYGYDYDKMAKYKIKRNSQIIELNYPARRSGTVSDWATSYVTFKNLPQILSITFDGDSPGIFTAQVVRISQDGDISLSTIQLNSENDGIYQANDLHPNEQLTLIFNSSLSGTYHYEAISNLMDINLEARRQNEIGMEGPLKITRPTGSIIRGGTLEQNQQIRHLGNVHLSSNYISLFIDGSYVYTTGEWGLEIFDISHPAAPLHIGEIPTPGAAEDVFAQGRYAYVADGEAGVQIIDVQQPDRPQLVTTYKDSLTYPHKIQVIGNYAYVADFNAGLQILDISDVHNPHLVGSYKPNGKTFALYVSGGYAYLNDGEEGFSILDISNVKIPKLVGSAEITGYDIVVSDGYAYVAGGNFAILDVRAPRAPRIIAKDIQTPGHVFSICLQEGYIYVADIEGGLSILDVRDVKNPRIIGRHGFTGHALGVAAKGDYVYIADGYGGLQAVDISTPNHTQWVSQYNTSGFAYAVDVYEGYAYIADGAGGLRIVDAQESSEAVLRTSYTMDGSAYDVDVYDGYAYVAAGEAGLLIIDIRNIDEPKTIAQIQTTDLAWGVTIGTRGRATPNGAYAYLAAGRLWILDVSDPQHPQTVAVHQIPGYAYKTQIVGNRAYITALDGGIQILDITEPKKLSIIGSYDPGGLAKSVYVFGNYAYIADSVSGLQVVDFSSPQQPKLAGVYLTDAETVDVQIARGYAYLLSRSSLEILSIQNPMDPQLITQFDNLTWTNGLDIDGKFIYVADAYDLNIFRFDNGATWAVNDSAMEEDSYSINKPVLRYQLGQNYPNPFNPETWIPYQLARHSDVTITIYNFKGELVRTIPLGNQTAGSYLKSAYWDGRNDSGEHVASGVYFYTMRADTFEATKKMLLRR